MKEYIDKNETLNNPNLRIGNPDIVLKKEFEYSGKMFMIYWYNNEPLFDIRHILLILEQKEDTLNKKYSKYVERIVKNFWYKNEYGGYILRELIEEKTMYDILLKSNSKISKSLKSDITKILIKLRKNNELGINSGKLVLKKKKRKLTDTEVNENHKITNEKLPDPNDINDENRILQRDNEADKEYINNLIALMRTKNFHAYTNTNVIYAYILTLRRDHKDILVKIGFSDDFVKRYGELLQEFQCEMYLIGVHVVHRQTDERNLHTLLKSFFPQNVEDVRIESKNKVEVYKFSKALFKQYNGICERLNSGNKDQLMFNTINNIVANNITDTAIMEDYAEIIRRYASIIKRNQETINDKGQEPFYLAIKNYEPEEEKNIKDENNVKKDSPKGKKKSNSKTGKYKETKSKSLVINKELITKKTNNVVRL
jgi:hypothetical protein